MKLNTSIYMYNLFLKFESKDRKPVKIIFIISLHLLLFFIRIHIFITGANLDVLAKNFLYVLKLQKENRKGFNGVCPLFLRLNEARRAED